ncbi:MAG: T9SS type A sorting domain-containing protein, partial [Sphingomonadales bacterium]
TFHMSMRKAIISIVLSSSAFFAMAQSSSRGLFVMSSDPATPIQYANLREVDATGRSLVKDIFDMQRNYAALGSTADTLATPLGGSVAAMAFDQRSNRIFFFPQYSSELRFIDLDKKGPRFTSLHQQSLQLLRHRNDVANQITRMTIGADGYGYALTNDAEHLIRFSTTGAPTIIDLGVLTDDAANTVFVKSSCTSWGGDMVADKNGNLILITQSNFVFSINIDQRVAHYLGQIEGLPAGFTTNGAAVDEQGALLLSCGSSRTLQLSQHLFRINDIRQLKAEPVDASAIPGFGNISDMASSFILSVPRSSSTEKSVVVSPSAPVKNITTAPSFTVFPNPVSTGTFSIRAQHIAEAGDYTLLVSDMTGRVVMERSVAMQSKSSTHSFSLPALSSKGTYVVMLVDYFKRTVFSTQLIVE